MGINELLQSERARADVVTFRRILRDTRSLGRLTFRFKVHIITRKVLPDCVIVLYFAAAATMFVVLIVLRMDCSDVQHRELNHSIENNTGEGRRFTLEKTKSSC